MLKLYTKLRLKGLFVNLLLVLLLHAPPLNGQGRVNLLLTKSSSDTPVSNSEALATSSPSQAFDFSRNLILFQADLEGTPGTFVLDTGAPRLLVNHQPSEASRNLSGIGAAGDVTVHDHYVSSFSLLGKVYRGNWALGMDLTAFENRMNRPIAGFVGYSMLRGGELRINYRDRRFSLLKSVRNPLHEDRAPDYTFALNFDDHLPVVVLRIAGRKYRFAIDTGASVNVLHRKYRHECSVGDAMTIIQGLGGRDQRAPNAILRTGEPDGPLQGSNFVLLDLDHLQTHGTRPLDGILGSEFLSEYTVGIDYRRGKLYLWQTQPATK